MTALERLQAEVAPLRLDDSLLFLNRLLAAARSDEPDSTLEPFLRARQTRAPAFVVHFLAKLLLRHASNLGLRPLDGPSFLILYDLFFQLSDPIVGDPAWPAADPTGFFERLLGQQLPPQRRNPLQKYGLALALFRDLGPVRTPEPYDLRADVEGELGLPVEVFMAMGLLCQALHGGRSGGRPCLGTFTHMDFAAAYDQGFRFATPDVWGPFLRRVACDRDAFRAACDNPLYRVRDARYAQFEFNPLTRFPATDTGGGRHVVVDPDLLVERTTFGLFYDLFERDGLAFAIRFGAAFDRLVGNMLGSVCPASLWSAAEWEAGAGATRPKIAGKVGDWAYRGRTHTVLFECKSLRPSLELLTYGSDEKVVELRARIVSAVGQLIGHTDSIGAGKWAAQGLAPASTVGVVVTYGHIQTVNGPFMRRRIREDLAAKKFDPVPYVVLSVEELDCVVRLVELGHPLDEVVARLAACEDSFHTLQCYAKELQGRAVSTFAYDRGMAFMEGVNPNAATPAE